MGLRNVVGFARNVAPRLLHRHSFAIVCGFIVACAFEVASVAQSPPDSASSADLQKQIVDALTHGRDAKALLEKIRSQAPAKSTVPPRNEDAADLERRLNDFEAAVKAMPRGGKADTIGGVLQQYEELLAANLLFQDRFTIVQTALAKENLSGEIESRRKKAQAEYEQTMSDLKQALDPSLGALLATKNREDLLNDPAFAGRLTESLAKARQILAAHGSRTAKPILRASTLPFRQSKLAQRAPKLTPTIIPSYLNPADAAVPSAPADLTATDDAPLSDEILAKAKSLDYDYIRIYEFVRNEVRTEWYAGGMKGAVGTLRQSSGNDVDQASLLIALFRASGLAARYVHGVMELSVDDIAQSLSLKDGTQVTKALTRAGLAFSPIVRGGRVAAVNIEQTWVTAQAPYTNYRGAAVDASGKIWIPLAPALKQYNIVLSTGGFTAAGLTASQSITDFLAQPQTQDLLPIVRKQVTDFLQKQTTPLDYASQLGTASVAQKQIGLLPNTLPVKVVAVTEESATLTNAHRQLVRFVVRNGTLDADTALIDLTLSVAQAASERITLSYIPATVDDQKTVDLFGGLDYVPAYLVKLRPQLKIDGRVKATGADGLSAGTPQRFEIHLISPFGEERVDETVLTGGYQAVGLYAQKVARVVPDTDPADTEYTAAKLLDRIATSYSDGWDKAESELGGLLDVSVVHPWPTVAVVGNALKAETVFNRVMSLKWQGVNLDAALRVSEPIAHYSSATTVAQQWMRLSALEGSALEHKVFEDEFLVNSISADKGLQIARAANNEIVTMTSANVDAVLATLTLPPEIKTDITNWARLGFSIDTPRNSISLSAWTGYVWRVEDPATGAAGYFISGGLAGGATADAPESWLLTWLRDALMSPNTSDPDNDPLSGQYISRISGDSQIATVGQLADQPLAVMVKNERGSPVEGAQVQFAVTGGTGQLLNEATQETVGIITVPTNHLGVASVRVEAGKVITNGNSIFVIRNAGETYATKVGINLVDAAVSTHSGPLALSHPFEVIGFPDVAAKIVRTNACCVGAALPFGTHDDVNVAVQDQYGNPVSNVFVKFDLTSSGDGSAGMLIGGCPGGCNGASINVATSDKGARTFVNLGTALQYSLQASSVVGNYATNYNLLTQSGLTYLFMSILDEKGKNTAGAKISGKFGYPITTGFFYYDGHARSVNPYPVESVTAQVDNGGSISGAIDDGGGNFHANQVVVGGTPGINNVSFTALVHNPSYPGTPDDGNTYPHFQNFPIISIFGVDAKITDIVTSDNQHGTVPLNDEGFLLTPINLGCSIAPAAYQGYTRAIDILQNGAWFDSAIANFDSGNCVSAALPRTTAFDISKTYEAQIVFNRASPLEIKSDKFKLPLSQRIIKDYDRKVRLTQSIDTLNNRYCVIGQSFKFEISQPAKITFTIIPDQSTNSRTDIVANQHYDAGEHEISLDPDQILPADYTFELKAVADSDSHDETVKGKLVSEFATKNSLPVGHVMVKGVDVKYGALSIGTTDLQFPGRGSALEFRRGYSTNGSGVIGPLGAHWSHNYESRLTIDQCGDITVSGGDAGASVFVDDGTGKLVPLKGYHGTLIANSVDRSFDFYSKDGTRYHYRLMGTRSSWDLEFIQDTNGNVTKLAYDPGSPAVAKLLTVEDSSKRTLKFTYENRTFDAFSAATPILVKVEGPGGTSVSFEYDAFGNMLSAKRELRSSADPTPARAESYAYTPIDPLFQSIRLLTAYTNPNGATTSYEFKPAIATLTLKGVGGFKSTVVTGYYVDKVTDGENGVTQLTFDTNSWTTTIVRDPNGHSTTYTLDGYGSPLSIADPVGTTHMTWATDDIFMLSKTDARGTRTDYQYDKDGNVLSETVDGASTTYTYQPFTLPPIKNRVAKKTDRNGNTTNYSYDSHGNLLTETNAENGVTSHSYATNGDRISTTDPNGNITRFTFDSYGNVDTMTDPFGKVTATEFNERSLPTLITDALGHATALDYDSLGRVVSKKDARGGVHTFDYDPVGNKLAETDAENHTTRWAYDGENRVKVITNALGDHKDFVYDPAGNKLSETDWNSNLTTYGYDEANRLVQRTEPLAKVTQFGYDSVGNVTTETDALNHTTTYEYDALNRRTKRTDAKSGVTRYTYDNVGNKKSETDALNRVTSFVYDHVNRLTERDEPLGKVTKFEYDPNGNKTKETDPNGGVRKFVYDALNRMTKRTDAMGFDTNLSYDAVGNLTVEINARTATTKHSYDELNRLIETIDASGAVTDYKYDKVGNRVEEDWANKNVVTHVYDKLNRLASSGDSLGTIGAYEYDGNGNRTKEVDANANITTREYDALNRLSKLHLPEDRTVSYGYDAVGNKTSETDARNYTTNFHYDELNRLDLITDPLTHTVAYTYDAVGNRLTETDKRGNTTVSTYDDLNRVKDVTDPLIQVVKFKYDLVGNKTSEIDKLGTETLYTYDKENRVLTTTKDNVPLRSLKYDEIGNRIFDQDANTNITTYIYDLRDLLLTEARPLAAFTLYKYDEMGNRVRMEDPEHRVSTYTYDKRRRLLTETNGANETTTYAYDGNGNKTLTQRPRGNAWAFAYDGADRLKSITDAMTPAGVTRYTYDKNNNRLTEQDANGHITADEYDPLNRNTAMVYPDTARAEFRYDENGNRIGLTDPSGQIFSYVFDKLNRETNKNYPVPASPTGDDIQSIVTTYDPNGNAIGVVETYSGATGVRTTAKSYDHFDRLTSVTDAFNKTIKYQYDANGNRTALTDPDGKVTRYSFDALNRVINVTNSSGVTSYDYDRSSLSTKTTYPNGTSAVTTYDGAKRVATINNKQGTSVVSSYGYTYDSNGNRTTQSEANGSVAENTSYAYDADDRLTTVAYPDKTTVYTYDTAYNRLTEKTTLANSTVQVDKIYSYNERNQLTVIADNLDSANNVAYNYDANGNQTIKTKNGFTTTFVYDVRDQLVAVRQDATTLGMFRYDYNGMRVYKDMGGQILRYSYDDDSVLLETDNAGTTVAKFDYGVHHLLSLTHVTEGREFYLFDGLGSIADLTNNAGSVQARYQYDAFGNFRAQAGTSFNRFGFTGHEKDNETGLYYFKARFYDPDTARFLSQDAYLGDVNTPPSLHRYLYAYSNPTVYVDLKGYAAESDEDRRNADGTKSVSASRLQAEYERTGDPRFSPEGLAESKKKAQEQLTQQLQREKDRQVAVEPQDSPGGDAAETHWYWPKPLSDAWDKLQAKNDELKKRFGSWSKDLFVKGRMASGGEASARTEEQLGDHDAANAIRQSVREDAERVGVEVEKQATKVAEQVIEAAETRGAGRLLPGAGRATKAERNAVNAEEDAVNADRRAVSAERDAAERAGARGAAETGDGIVLRIEQKEWMDPKEFDRKVSRLRKAVEEGRAVSNIPHGISDAERSALTKAYRKDVEDRIMSLYKNNPQARENALRRLEQSDIDHMLDLQLRGENSRRNLKALERDINRDLGFQIRRQLPRGEQVPITGVEVVRPSK